MSGNEAEGAPPPEPPTAAVTSVPVPVPAAPRKPPRRGVKVVPERPKRALFCLSLNNYMRKHCIEFVEWKYPLQCNNVPMVYCWEASTLNKW